MKSLFRGRRLYVRIAFTTMEIYAYTTSQTSLKTLYIHVYCACGQIETSHQKRKWSILCQKFASKSVYGQLIHRMNKMCIGTRAQVIKITYIYINICVGICIWWMRELYKTAKTLLLLSFVNFSLLNRCFYFKTPFFKTKRFMFVVFLVNILHFPS